MVLSYASIWRAAAADRVKTAKIQLVRLSKEVKELRRHHREVALVGADGKRPLEVQLERLRAGTLKLMGLREDGSRRSVLDQYLIH